MTGCNFDPLLTFNRLSLWYVTNLSRQQNISIWLLSNLHIPTCKPVQCTGKTTGKLEHIRTVAYLDPNYNCFRPMCYKIEKIIRCSFLPSVEHHLLGRGWGNVVSKRTEADCSAYSSKICSSYKVEILGCTYSIVMAQHLGSLRDSMHLEWHQST